MVLILNYKYIIILIFYIYDIYLQNPSFSNKKALQQKAEGLMIFWLPQQNDFRTFCIGEETKKVYRKLEEITNT
jgi:hypothetical protein